jgi:NAD(P)-dependent dehydrogenase (short-subunit alcohol dehydrogenase family)
MASVLITGTSKGIGLETALAFGRASHQVYATMRNPSQSPALAETAAREFEAALAFGGHPDLPQQIGRLDSAGADLLGLIGTTLLVMRPDGYIGLRSDGDHIRSLERYCALVCGGGV